MRFSMLGVTRNTHDMTATTRDVVFAYAEADFA
jgi:hypothetical protein